MLSTRNYEPCSGTEMPKQTIYPALREFPLQKTKVTFQDGDQVHYELSHKHPDYITWAHFDISYVALCWSNVGG